MGIGGMVGGIRCKIKYFMKFSYEGTGYSKKVGCNFDESHKVGDIIQLKHLEGTDIFLFPEESIIKEFLAFGALALFGVVGKVQNDPC